ncbi:g10594 [Coccomyxa viridis]|uniref:G10594 protein n=1 Tax=Coccomyxa viridis TaxID=1274662 RepID=A0ABP1G5P8_9CHLO
MMQGQVDHGPVATAGPRAVPFPPAFSLSQSQHYGAPLRPLEPPPQGFAPLYPHSRPDGKRNRPRKSKNAQGRGRRSSKNAALKPGFDAMLKANRQQTKKHFQRLAETPRNLSHGAPVDVSHLAISEALKPGGGHFPDVFSPASTPASTRHNRDPDNDINFFGTNIGLVQDYSSESATDAAGSDEEEEEEAGAVRDAAYVFSLEQENDSLKQINLDLREELSLLRQQLEERRPSGEAAVPESCQEAMIEEEERPC